MESSLMLTTKQELLSGDDAEKLRVWLHAPGAQLFRRLLQARIHEKQIEATQKFSDLKENLQRERMDEDGAALVKKALVYRTALDVLAEFSEPKIKLYTVRIIEEP